MSKKTKQKIKKRKLLVLRDIAKTCDAYPAQWSGISKEGHKIYIRYRHGIFRLDIDDETVLRLDMGDDVGGEMTTDEMLELVGSFIKVQNR